MGNGGGGEMLGELVIVFVWWERGGGEGVDGEGWMVMIWWDRMVWGVLM